MKHNLTASARRFGGALKAIAIAGAVSVALSAQAEYVSPGITINGSKPTSEGSFSGYTYYNGVFTLTSASSTYTFAGEDTSGKVRIVAAANCTIRLSAGFKLSLEKFNAPSPFSLANTAIQSSPISLSGNVSVTVRAEGEATLRGARQGPGVRVVDGQTLYLTSTGSGILRAYGGGGGAGIGTGYWDSPCGKIYVRGRVYADGGKACGVGQGAGGGVDSPPSGGKIYIDSDAADLLARGGYPAAAIGTAENSIGTTTI